MRTSHLKCLLAISTGLLWSSTAQADARVWNPYASAAATRAIVEDDATTAVRQINWRRSMVGLPPLAAQSALTLAAQRHSRYLSANATLGHGETRGLVSFSGATVADRLTAANYPWQTYGEVISAGQATGPWAIEALMEAIYHRFGMLRSDITEAGGGFDDAHPDYQTIFTMDMGAQQRMDARAGQGWLGTYPAHGQDQVPIDFYSDTESPDPMAGVNRVGYPVSVHGASSETLTVSRFELSAGGAAVPTHLMQSGSDSNTPRYAAALVPLQPLQPGQTYQVAFAGNSGGQAVNRTWSFTTAPAANIRFLPASLCLAPGSAGKPVALSGGAGTFTNVGWSNASVIKVSWQGADRLLITPLVTGSAQVTVTDSSNATAAMTVTVSAACPPSGAPDTERLFTWAEAAFPRYLAPAGQATQTAGGYTYRYYPTTNTYLGVREGMVYFADGYAGVLTPLIDLATVMPSVAQAGY